MSDSQPLRSDADLLRLIAKWRKTGQNQEGCCHDECADELEAALSTLHVSPGSAQEWQDIRCDRCGESVTPVFEDDGSVSSYVTCIKCGWVMPLPAPPVSSPEKP